MVIDAHVHLYPPYVARDPAAWALKAGESHWAALCARTRRDGRPVQSFPTVEELLREMDAAGVARAVLLGWYWEKPETCAWQNRFYTACVRAHPDRLSAFAALQPRAGHWAALEEMHRARDGGLVGIGELSPHSQGYAVDDAAFGEVLTLAADWKMPVNLHVTDPAGRTYPGRVETPLADFVQLARAWPRTQFVLAHWGGLLPLVEATANAATLPNVYYDTAASPLIYDADIWARALPVIGADRMLFGSDFPLNLFPKQDVRPNMARFISEARTGGADLGVLGGNVAQLLRLKVNAG